MTQPGRRRADAEHDPARTGNDGARRTASRLDRLQIHGRKVQADAGDMLAELEGVLEELATVARDQLRERPYATLGAAAGLGYVLGGGIAANVTRLAFHQGARLALTLAVGRLMGGSPDPERSDA